jgi:hypothetical protein
VTASSPALRCGYRPSLAALAARLRLAVFALAFAAVPPVEITLLDPSRDLASLAPLFATFAKADPTLHPDAIRRSFAASYRTGDPFAHETWRSLGIDTKRPIRWIATDRTWAVEATLSDPKKLVLPRTEAVAAGEAPWSSATLAGGAGRPLLIAIAGGRVVAIELAPGMDPATAFREVESLERSRIRSKGPWVVRLSGVDEIEQADLTAKLEPKRWSVSGTMRLALASRLLSDEVVLPTKAKRLLDAMPSKAMSLSGTAGPGAIREALIEAGLPSNEADEAKKLFSGEHSVALGEDGTLVAAARISGSAKEAAVAAFIDRMKTIDPVLDLRRQGPFVLGLYRGPSESAVTKWLAAPSLNGEASASAVEVDLSPPVFFSSLRNRARGRGPRIGLARLTLVEALYGPLLRSMRRVRGTASRGTGALDIDATFEIE